MQEKFRTLIHYLDPDEVFPNDIAEQEWLLRALMNRRATQLESAEFYALQDEVLQAQLARKGVLGLDDLDEIQPNLYLWQGDITRLQVDAIVNAANAYLLGCFQPVHACIDNAIHSQAGLQLRWACHQLMEKQGHLEATGKAKITPAFNLPSAHVIHTVGPIIRGELSESDCALLAQSYRSCLEIALENGVQSIAFCCISTGEFRFPNQAAAEIAVREVKAFLRQHAHMKVVFNVFKEQDLRIYQQLLSA
ncbi:MAG: protein-ADP-ribose hydrolase [Neisseria sp.]|nr:protein-ADP-ribose hydrolase [Neisseria sp.]